MHLGEGDGARRSVEHDRQLKIYIPPPDRALTGTASWLNFYLGRDSRPGRPKDLWKGGAGPGRTVPIEEDERLKTAGPSAADKALAARTAKPKPRGKSRERVPTSGEMAA